MDLEVKGTINEEGITGRQALLTLIDRLQGVIAPQGDCVSSSVARLSCLCSCEGLDCNRLTYDGQLVHVQEELGFAFLEENETTLFDRSSD